MKEETAAVTSPETSEPAGFVDKHQIIKDGVKRVHVFGKDNNSLARGIIEAFILINPDTTPQEVNKAFPIQFDENTPGEIIIDKYNCDKIEQQLATKFIKIDDYYETDYDKRINIYVFDKKSNKVGIDCYFIKKKWIIADINKLKKEAIEYGIEARIGEAIGKIHNSSRDPYSLVPVNGFIPEESKKRKKHYADMKSSIKKLEEKHKKSSKSFRRKFLVVLLIIAAFILYKYIF